MLFLIQEAECAYVIILMAVYWCTEVLPLAVTALLPALLFPLFGIMQSKDVSQQSSEETVHSLVSVRVPTHCSPVHLGVYAVPQGH